MTKTDAMPSAARIAEDLDRYEVEKVYHRARLARDMHWWDEFVPCYHDDSLINIMWFKGTAAEFAQQSIGLATRTDSFHEVQPGVVKLNGNRAILSNMVVIHLAVELDGVEVDCISYCIARMRVENRTGDWRIAATNSFYIHDRIVPRIPGQIPKIDMEKLNRFPSSYKCLAYVHEARGTPSRLDSPGMHDPESLRRLFAADEAWLAGGKA